MVSPPVALIINLKKRKDRWDKFQKRMTEIDPTFISKYYRVDAVNNSENPLRGCSESHLRALKLAKKRKWLPVMICEDDVYFKDDAKKRFDYSFKEIYENKMDVSILLGGISGFGCPGTEPFDIALPKYFKRTSKNIVSPVKMDNVSITGSHCIVYLTQESIDNTIYEIEMDLLKPKVSHVDQLMFKYHMDKIAICHPYLALVLENDKSDIRTENNSSLNDLEEYILWSENLLEKIQ